MMMVEWSAVSIGAMSMAAGRWRVKSSPAAAPDVYPVQTGQPHALGN